MNRGSLVKRSAIYLFVRMSLYGSELEIPALIVVMRRTQKIQRCYGLGNEYKEPNKGEVVSGL